MKMLKLFAALACVVACLAATPAEADCSRDADCNDGQFCNGRELCHIESYGSFRTSYCERGTPYKCTAPRVCDEGTDSCVIPPPCERDQDCQDGVFCNGVERCMPGAPGHDVRGCIPPTSSACMAGQICNEAGSRCEPACSDDTDGDGVVSLSCGGADCDDSDRTRFPAATETCSASNPNHDEDCNPDTVGDIDEDGDGEVSVICCNFQPSGERLCGDDCDDRNPGVNGNAPEVCDGVDNNCNGEIDEGVVVELFTDQDGDNHGTPRTLGSPPVVGCPGAPGKATIGNDCDDTNPAIQPGALVCDPAFGPGGVKECLSNGGLTPLFRCADGLACVNQPNGTGACVEPQP